MPVSLGLDRILAALVVPVALVTAGAVCNLAALALQDAPTQPEATEEAVAEDVDAPPPIEFEPKSIDFGFVEPKSVVKGNLKIWNKSDKPLVILAVQPSCKCTTLNDLSGQEIPVGGFAVIDAQMKSQPAPGVKKASIKVLIEGFSRVAEVEMKAEVALPIRAKPGIINAVRAENTSGRIEVSSLDGKPFRILSFHGQPPKFEGYDPSQPPQPMYLVNYDLAEFEGKEMPRYLIFETDRPECATLDVMVRHQSTVGGARNFALRPNDMRTNLGLMEEGKTYEFEVEFEAVNETDPLLTVMSSDPNTMEAKLVSATKGLNAEQVEVTIAKVAVTPKNGIRGLYYGTVKFYTSRKEQPIVVFGRVVEPSAGAEKAATAKAG
jgi:hypothetical protein